jgi:arylformamidase
MMLATRWPDLDIALPADLVKGALAISGLYDLEPLLHVKINEVLGLDLAAAKRNSPVLHVPATQVPLVLAVGEIESDEFRRQQRLLACAWSTIPVREIVVPGCHHFSIPLELADTQRPLFRAACELMRIA